LVQEANTIEAK